MSDFDLNSLVRDVCLSSTEVHPDVLAEQVLARISGADVPAALGQALSTVVRKYVSRDRRPLYSPARQAPSGNQTTTAGGGSHSGRSSKVKAIRAWARRCEARVNVGPNEFKFFGDCSLDDLVFMKTQRREHAAQNLAAADEIERYEQLMVRFQVSRVRDLPESSVIDLGAVA